jgi:hypothetical protein
MGPTPWYEALILVRGASEAAQVDAAAGAGAAIGQETMEGPRDDLQLPC